MRDVIRRDSNGRIYLGIGRNEDCPVLAYGVSKEDGDRLCNLYNSLSLEKESIIEDVDFIHSALDLCIKSWGVRDVFLLPEEKAALNLAREAVLKAEKILGDKQYRKDD